jgi:putative tryptophan/tyrosine transport system substrate-binding protein
MSAELIRRRLFLFALVPILSATGTALYAQAPRELRTVGLVSFASRSDDPTYQAFRQRLRELGYVEGRNIKFEFRSAQGNADRFPTIADELVALNVDVIVVGNSVAARAMMRATSTTPIVITVSDPLGLGLVTNLARPGGNVTGLSTMSTELLGKRLELLKETIPGLTRVAVLWHPYGPTSQKWLDALEATAPPLSLELKLVTVRTPSELSAAFSAASRAQVQAVYILGSPLFYAYRATLAQLALKARLPAIYEAKPFVDDGGFMSYGADYIEQSRRAADYVDRILNGAKAGDLPIEQATKIELAFNLRTAKALGITIPASVLARADRLVQ